MPSYEKFKTIIDEMNAKPSAVAKATGISSTVFSDWKSGKSKPKIDKLVKIADFLGVSLGELIEET